MFVTRIIRDRRQCILRFLTLHVRSGGVDHEVDDSRLISRLKSIENGGDVSVSHVGICGLSTDMFSL